MLSLIVPIMAIFLAEAAVAQKVTTEIETQNEGSFLFEESHPLKFDAKSMTFCSGKNMKAPSGSFRGNNKFRGLEGQEADAMDSSSSRSRLKSVEAQRLQWDTRFNLGDYTFHVFFKKRKSSGQYFHQRSTCVTKSWKYSVDKATSTFQSSVALDVPDNVYVVRIKSDIPKGSPQLKINVRSAYEPNKDNAIELRAVKDGELANGVRYFFVKPGEEIRLDIEHKDDGSNVEILADFEVTFAGYNRCEQGVREFKALSGLGANDPLTKEVVQKSFDQIIQQAGLSQLNEDELDKSMLFIGCLTSKDFADALIYDTNFHQVNAILNGIDNLSGRLSQLTLSGPNVALKRRIPALRALEAMARNSVSASVLSTLRPMCENVTYYDRATKKTESVTYYIYFRHQLDKVAQWLGLKEAAQSTGLPSQFYQELLRSMQSLNGLSEKSILEKRRPEVIALAEIFQSNGRVNLTQKARHEAYTFPEFAAGRDSKALTEGIDELNAQVIRVNGLLYDFFTGISGGGDEMVDLGPLTAAVAKMADLEAQIQRHFSKVFQAFSGNRSEKFRDDLQMMSDNHHWTTHEWLTKVYGGFLKDFAERNKLRANGQSAELISEVIEKCL